MFTVVVFLYRPVLQSLFLRRSINDNDDRKALLFHFCVKINFVLSWDCFSTTKAFKLLFKTIHVVHVTIKF